MLKVYKRLLIWIMEVCICVIRDPDRSLVTLRKKKQTVQNFSSDQDVLRTLHMYEYVERGDGSYDSTSLFLYIRQLL
jgi:hypothetical protein